ncbi:MAG: cysteine hydrolase family protein, partial [Dehalococcoidia bacterium]
ALIRGNLDRGFESHSLRHILSFAKGGTKRMTPNLNIPKLIEKSALLVIDPQNDFLLPDAPYGGGPEAREFIENTSLLVDKMRQRGVPIIFTREVHRPDGVDLGREGDAEPIHCVEGTPGMELVDELTPKDGDYVIDKRKFSCFFQTDLLGLLTGLGTELIVLSGGTANCCVLASAIDAYQYGFHTVTIGDCVFSGTGLLDPENFKDLYGVYQWFSNPMTLREFIDLLENGRRD